MEIKHKYFKLTPFTKLLVFLSLFFIVIIIPVVVDAYLTGDKFCLAPGNCLACEAGEKCPDNKPGYNAYCAWTGDRCPGSEKVALPCEGIKIKSCEYELIATSTPTPTSTHTPTPTPKPTPTPTSTPTHKECNANNKCVSVSGSGTNKCTNDASCTTATHKECNNNYTGCISVAGAGADQCTTDASCATDTATHKECNFNKHCVSTAGAGDDECTDDASCATASPTSTPTGDGSIKVKAKLDGSSWTGAVNYALSGPETIDGTAVTTNHSDVSVGTYTISVTSGGPDNALLDDVSPAASLTILAGQTTTFTLKFKTIIGASHKECNISNQCATVIGAGADTCTDDVSCSGGPTPTSTPVPASHKVCNASDQCVSVAGSGPDQCINDSSCTLPPVGFVCNFSWSPESPKAKSAVNFFDYTQTPEGTTLISWDWIFESGTPTTSSDQNPGAVIFNSAGEKTVTLSATNSDNEVCTLSQEITVQSLNPKWIEVLPK